MAIAHVSTTVTATGAGTASLAVAFGAITAGDLLACSCTWGNATLTATCTDTLGNTWTGGTLGGNVQAADTANGQSSATFWSVAQSSGTCTATMVVPATAFTEGGGDRFSGIASTSPTDGTNLVQTQAADATPSTGSITTTVDGDLLFSCLGTTDGQSVTNPPSTWTKRLDGLSFATADLIVQAAAGTINPTWATASGKYNGLTMSFKAAGGAPDAPADITQPPRRAT